MCLGNKTLANFVPYSLGFRVLVCLFATLFFLVHFFVEKNKDIISCLAHCKANIFFKASSAAYCAEGCLSEKKLAAHYVEVACFEKKIVKSNVSVSLPLSWESFTRKKVSSSRFTVLKLPL